MKELPNLTEADLSGLRLEGLAKSDRRAVARRLRAMVEALPAPDDASAEAGCHLLAIADHLDGEP